MYSTLGKSSPYHHSPLFHPTTTPVGTLASPSPSPQTKSPNPVPQTRATQASPPLFTPPPPLRNESNPREVFRLIRDESSPRGVSRHIRDEESRRRGISCHL